MPGRNLPMRPAALAAALAAAPAWAGASRNYDMAPLLAEQHPFATHVTPYVWQGHAVPAAQPVQPVVVPPAPRPAWSSPYAAPAMPAPVPAPVFQPAPRRTVQAAPAMAQPRMAPQAAEEQGGSWLVNTARKPGNPLWKVLSEARIGASLHNTGPFATKTESGIDVDMEFLFTSPDFLRFLWSPRPHVGMHINTQGETSQFWVGLAWTAELWGWLLIEGTFGIAVHDGKLHDFTGERREFGARVLARESIAIGVVFGEQKRHNAVVYLDHVSHGSLLDEENEGMDNIGMRYG
jgi:lipid A 3-O-deacylase